MGIETMGSRRGTYVTDFNDFLDDQGDLADMPTPALNLALHLASIIAWMTNQKNADLEMEWTNVPCRRSPRRRRCNSDILAAFESTPQFGIRWWCPICGDNGFLYGWENTVWDRGVWSDRPQVTH